MSKRRKVFVNTNPTVTMATAAPINMRNFPDVDKPIKKTPKKREMPKRPEPKETEKQINLDEIQTHPKGDDLEEWKRLVILAVEKVVDDAIEAMVVA